MDTIRTYKHEKILKKKHLNTIIWHAHQVKEGKENPIDLTPLNLLHLLKGLDPESSPIDGSKSLSNSGSEVSLSQGRHLDVVDIGSLLASTTGLKVRPAHPYLPLESLDSNEDDSDQQENNRHTDQHYGYPSPAALLGEGTDPGIHSGHERIQYRRQVVRRQELDRDVRFQQYKYMLTSSPLE